MAGSCSDVHTLTLHAVRLLGFADSTRVAQRYGLAGDQVLECLLDMQAHGWVIRSEFSRTSGWSLTARGRAEGERRLADELDACGARPVVTAVHERFLPLNARFQEAVTRWQLRPLPGDPMAANDHADFRWDDRVIDSLGSLGRALAAIDAELTDVLPRLGRYAARYDAALERVLRSEPRWVDGVGIDSCHVVWMQLHEDLLATLGLERGAQP